MIKKISWKCSNRLYNEVDNIRLVDNICLCDAHVVEDGVRIHSVTNIWFDLDNMPFKLSKKEIEEINNPIVELISEETIEDAEVIDE